MNFRLFLSLLLVATLAIMSNGVSAQDTFSIVAVDTITGEVGGAGASCLDDSAIAGGVLIISDIIPSEDQFTHNLTGILLINKMPTTE